MEITPNSVETNRGPGDWFTGEVYIDTVAVPGSGSRISASQLERSPQAGVTGSDDADVRLDAPLERRPLGLRPELVHPERDRHALATSLPASQAS